MEDKIRSYENFIKEKADGHIGPIERVKLAEYHKEMVTNFQHERLIHLLVTFFFGFMAICALTALGVSLGLYGIALEMSPLYLLTILLIVLEIFYIKHYYFLENHVQSLYKYSKILHLNRRDRADEEDEEDEEDKIDEEN